MKKVIPAKYAQNFLRTLMQISGTACFLEKTISRLVFCVLLNCP